MLHLALMGLSALLCLALPIGGAVWLHKRLGPRLALAGWGALAFVGSQVVHIPLNVGVSKLFAEGHLRLPPDHVTVWLVPLALGLSAGLCEEPARYLAFRLLKQDRSWSQGLMLGLGHGGLEAIGVGAVIASRVVGIAVIQAMGIDSLDLPPEAAELVQQQLDGVFEMPAVAMLGGALERAFAMGCHLAMSLMVLQAARGRGLGWILMSVLFHTGLNAGDVWLVQQGHPVGAEVFIGLWALFAAAIVFALRVPPPAPDRAT